MIFVSISSGLATRWVPGGPQIFSEDDLFLGAPQHSAHGNGTPDSNAVLRQYNMIGEALTACEASSWRVGVPWLPPTTRVRRLPKITEGTCEDHLRYNLVGINTKVLESFCEDLDNLAGDAKSLESLHVPSLTANERKMFILIVALIGGCVAYLLASSLSDSPLIVGLITLIAMVSAGLAAFATSTETYRRTSFSWLIEAEIRRRVGGDDPSSNKLQVCPTANS